MAADVEQLRRSEEGIDPIEGSLQILWLLLSDRKTRWRQLTRIIHVICFCPFHRLLLFAGHDARERRTQRFRRLRHEPGEVNRHGNTGAAQGTTKWPHRLQKAVAICARVAAGTDPPIKYGFNLECMVARGWMKAIWDRPDRQMNRQSLSRETVSLRRERASSLYRPSERMMSAMPHTAEFKT
jgi:hypothetical protein